MQPKSQKMLKKIIKYTISVGLAAVLLWFSLREVEWVEFVEELQKCNMGLILLSMAGGAFAFWLRALRWRQLLLPLDPQTKRITTFNGVNIGNISNFVFPRIGEFVRCGVIIRRTTISYDKVFGTVVLERGWELLVTLLLLAIVLVAGFSRFGTFFVEKIWTPTAERFNMWWVFGIGLAALALVIFVIWKFRNRNRFCGKIAALIKGVLQGFSSCLHMEKKWLFFGYTAMIWLTYWFMAATTVWSAPFLGHLDIIDALFLSLVGGIGIAVPVPGGIGAFHYIVALTLSTVYGVQWELAVIYATIAHTSQAIVQMICGFYSYGYEAIKNK